MKKRPEKIAAVRNSKATSWRVRLFWPLLLLLLISPVIAWKFAEKQTEVSSELEHAKPGPWGDLEYVPISIEIPDQFVNVEEIDDTDWVFKNFSHEQTVEFLKTCDLTSTQLDSLLAQAKWTETEGDCHVVPSDAWIENLSAESRAKIYPALAQFPENVNQFFAFSFRPERLLERLEFSGLSDSTIALLKKLLYPQGAIVRFADSDVILRKLSDHKERLRFVKTISRRTSLLVKLKVDPKSDINGLIEYWGADGRAKDLRPLLESLARVPSGCIIDIAHLLPPFARQRIYTYPQPTENTNAGQEDCHWTAVNFFNDHPLPGFANPNEVSKYLEANFSEIGGDTGQAHLGDVICLKTPDGIIVHSAVYIADNIVFTKNGAGLNQPWIYVRMEDMLPYYTTPNDPLKIVTYRRKSI